LADEEKDSKKESDNKEKDTKRDFKDTQQEIMFDLKLKTDEVLKKFKEIQKKNKVKFGGM